MKTNSSLIALMAGVAFLLSAGAACAGNFSKLVPPATTSNLRGTLKFYPTGGGHRFKCKVRLILFTGKGTGIKGKLPVIDTATGLDCPQFFFFESLPWRVGLVEGAETAEMISFSWAEQGGPSCSYGGQPFAVSKNGIWTATSGCVTGTLTSDPPIKIKP